MGETGYPLFGLRGTAASFRRNKPSPLQTDDGILATSAMSRCHRAKNAMRASPRRRRYRSLVEEIPAVTFVAPFDESVGELYVSPQIVNMLGFTQQEWLNDPVLWYRQLHQEDRERWHQEFARTCASAEQFRSVYRFKARDGRTVWVHGEAKVVRDADGRPLFLQGVAFDITERKEAEQKLKELNRRLEERVTERTAALQRSNGDLARFGGRVAHDIQKPINRVFSILNGPFTGSGPSDPPKKRLAKIESIAHEMTNLVQGMLEFALAKDTKEFALTDCSSLVREVREELNSQIEACGAVVTFHSLPTVVAHRQSLKAVFKNLIDNAIKYRSKRPLEIDVSARLQKGVWEFRVRDNGIGIKKGPDLDPEIKMKVEIDYHKKIFGLGERVATKGLNGEAIPGHGIGLSYCKSVIEHHGGKIDVESKFGKGSIVWFTLPAVADAASS